METAELAVSTSSDLSIFGLFLAADLLVKSVMILLVTASIWSWSIMIQKTRSFQKNKRVASFVLFSPSLPRVSLHRDPSRSHCFPCL